MNKYYKNIITLTLMALISVFGLSAAHAAFYKAGDGQVHAVWLDEANLPAGFNEVDDVGISLVNTDVAVYWGASEPNNSSGEHCAVQKKDGTWNDVGCSIHSEGARKRYAACYNGSTWKLSSKHSNQPLSGSENKRSDAIASCGAGYYFAAPKTKSERDALSAIIPSRGSTNIATSNSGDVWINAQDNTAAASGNIEGRWLINGSVPNTVMFKPIWASGEPVGGSEKKCAYMGSNGSWYTDTCSTERKLLCVANDNSDRKLTNGTYSFEGTKELNTICREEYGVLYNFYAPKSVTENNTISTLVGSAAPWINAQSIQHTNYWVVNRDHQNWAAGQPNTDGGKKLCAVARQSDGKWESYVCSDEAKLLCTNHNFWDYRNYDHQFTNQALEACSRPNVDNVSVLNAYRNHSLKTPTTMLDFEQAYTAIRSAPSSTKLWLNIKHLADADIWLINESYQSITKFDLSQKVWYDLYKKTGTDAGACYDSFSWTKYGSNPVETMDCATARAAGAGTPVFFQAQEPNDSGNCVQLYVASGNWDDTPCDKEFNLACFNGYDWKITANKYKQASNNSTGSEPDLLAAAHTACSLIKDDNGVAGNYRFAAPQSYYESQKLQYIANANGATGLWINGNDKKNNRTFVFNTGVNVVAPFWNSTEPNNGFNKTTNNQGPVENCAVQNRDGEQKWNDVACSNTGPIACYDPFDGNNGKWQIASVNVSYTTAEQMTEICQKEINGRYKFFAPTTLSQKDDLIAAMVAKGGTPQVYINANDIRFEGAWEFNQDINNWAIGQPDSATDLANPNYVPTALCATVEAATSWWSSRNCSETYRVACSTGSDWYFTAQAVSLSEYGNAEKQCVKEFGPGYLFAAPRTLEQALKLQVNAKQQGFGGHFWINGNRIETPTKWTWNATRLTTPVWGYENQPDGGDTENCAMLNNDSMASWSDENCAAPAVPSGEAAYLCRNGNNWQITEAKGTLDDFATAYTACANLSPAGSWHFAAPTTYNENLNAKNAMGLNVKVWVNATDKVSEGDWLLNAAPIQSYNSWAGNTSTGDCVYQSNDGNFYTDTCSSNDVRSWACTDGRLWKVTKNQGTITKFSQGHKACLDEYGVNYVFAAPLTMDDKIQLDFARLQANHESSNSVEKVWLNMTSSNLETEVVTNGRHFRRNLPYTNWSLFNAGNEPAATTCAYKSSAAKGANNPWLTESCTNFAAHYACTNGDVWQIALAKGNLVANEVQTIPQVGIDYWSYERGNAMCKEQFGPSFYFSAPINASEELALDAAINKSSTSVKNVWLNYYANRVLTAASYDSLWFGNRVKLNIWQKTLFDNRTEAVRSGTADCALLHQNKSYTDISCSNNASYVDNKIKYAFACFDGAEWSVEGEGYWDQGFEVCETENMMFAVPRNPEELEELTSKMLPSQSIWINLNDVANEGQWISNRLRFAWWAEGEPLNDGNKDCARVKKSDGKWYAGKCTLESAPFACRKTTSGSTGATTAWKVTTSQGVWSDGFAACIREFGDLGYRFEAPQGHGTTSATLDQSNLKSVIGSAAKDAWINLSDQESEGAWRGYTAYTDWGVSSLFDANADCGYIDRQGGSKGTWYAGKCQDTVSSAISRGYSCTNGQQWKIIETTATTDLRWSAGFTACDGLGEGWRFAAPSNAVQNRQVLLAMEIAGVNQVWINAHDRITEGEWQINGLETNFPPSIVISADPVVPENTDNILLKATITDDEEVGINSDLAITKWEIISNRNISSTDTTENLGDISLKDMTLIPGATGADPVILEAKYKTPVLFKEDRLLVVKVTATDLGSGKGVPATTEMLVNIRIQAPLLAAWDFESTTRPGRDTTGHGYDILPSTMTSATIVNDITNGVASRVAKMRPDSLLKVNGTVIGEDPVNGLNFSELEYTVAFRFSIEEAPTGKWRGLVQKGTSGRQPALFLFENNNTLHTTNSTTKAPNRAANSSTPMHFQQWLNVIYEKHIDKFIVYIDGVEATRYTFDDETSVPNEDGFYIGNIPGAQEGFAGLIDDIQIYTRLLSPTEKQNVLPRPPLGTVSFKEASDTKDEFYTAPNNVVNFELKRERGSFEELTVYVNAQDIGNGTTTALRGTAADMATPTNPADFAFTEDKVGGSYVANKGVPVTWAANDRADKSFSITLDNGDDEIREPTEFVTFDFTFEPNAKGVTEGVAARGINDTFKLFLTNLTPNPAGVFTVGVKDGAQLISEKRIKETDTNTYEICFRRDTGGVTAVGEVQVNYAIGGNAVAKFIPEDPDEPIADFDYEVLPGGLQLGDDVIFANGDSADKCMLIKASSNPTRAHHNVNVILQNIVADAAAEEALHDENNSTANLIIQDYAAGTFGFTGTNSHCYEPVEIVGITSPAWGVPEGSMTCTVTVKRSDAGLTGPAASLKLLAVNKNGAVYDRYEFADTLEWPAIDENDPTTNVEEQQVEFIIDAVDVQNGDIEVTLSLQPQTPAPNAEVIAGNTTLDLYIQDVTSPALITVARTSAAVVDEGTQISFKVQRSGGNNATQFNIPYEVKVYRESNNDPYTTTDYVEPIAGANSRPLTGTVAFTAAKNDETFTFKTIDTITNNPDIKVKLELANPARPSGETRPSGVPLDDVVGLGAFENTGKGENNSTDAEVRVNNTRDLIKDNYSVVITDTETGFITQTTNLRYGSSGNIVPEYLANIPKLQPDSRTVGVKLVVDNGKHMDDRVFNYKVTLVDENNNTLASNDHYTVPSNLSTLYGGDYDSSFDYESSGANINSVVEKTMTVKLPFVLKNTEFRLKVEVAANSNDPGFVHYYPVTVKPLWRQLKSNAGSCLVEALSPNEKGIGDCGSTSPGEDNYYPDTFWAWNSYTGHMVNMRAYNLSRTNQCIQISTSNSTDASMVKCDTTASNAIASFANVKGGGYNDYYDEYQVDSGSRLVCYRSNGYLHARTDKNNCRASGRQWDWNQ